jgi:hypothetical protein
MPRQSTRGSGGRGNAGGSGNGTPPEGGEPTGGAVEPIEIQEEMERSFLEYSMSVIVARALPDVRDGLKPVHRRILYSMFDKGLRPDRPHHKCAKVVGEVMGTYHPHGDSAIYEALARMVQTFSLRHPLIDGHGSFGGRSPDDGPAAMRYTECRLAPLALELMADIDEETVDMIANYDGSEEEPYGGSGLAEVHCLPRATEAPGAVLRLLPRGVLAVRGKEIADILEPAYARLTADAEGRAFGGDAPSKTTPRT